MKKLMLILVAMTAVAVAMPAVAKDGKDRGKGMKGFLSLLSAEQQKQAEALHLDFLKKTEPIRAAVSAKKLEIKELAYKDNPDENALQKKRHEIWALKDQLRNERRSLSKNLRAMLTLEQRAKVGPFAPKLGDKSKHHKGWRGVNSSLHGRHGALSQGALMDRS